MPKLNKSLPIHTQKKKSVLAHYSWAWGLPRSFVGDEPSYSPLDSNGFSLGQQLYYK